MRRYPILLVSLILAAASFALPLFSPLFSQEPEEEAANQAAAEEGRDLPPLSASAELVVEPLALTLEVGQKGRIHATLRDGDEIVEGRTVVFFSRNRRSLGVKPNGEVEAFGPGEHTVVVLVPRDSAEVARRAEALLRVEVTVTVPDPPIASVDLVGLPARLYAGTTVPLSPRLVDTSGVERHDVAVTYQSSAPGIAAEDGFGNLALKAPGKATLTATAESATSTLTVDVSPDPTVTLVLEGGGAVVRTGDVVWLRAVGRDRNGTEVPALPATYAVAARVQTGIIAAGSSADISQDGAFVAERPGVYTVVANAGRHSATQRIRVEPREVQKRLTFVGQGKVRDRHTSDLWVWQGADGRDYAITGTWGAEGHAYFWDVTHPESIALVDTVRVDARTVNDVKISEDGKIAVISREGASNRKNGIVILDISEPQLGVRVLSAFDDQLRGGVHNVFIYDQHVYAVNNGRRFDIINIEDPAQPYRVGRFELDTPGHSIHDVWVKDGIAFSSNWDDGVYAIDVGGGGKGGAPNNPVVLGSYQYPSGWNHAAFPYRSKSTGKFYVFAGDEAFPYGLSGRVPGEAPPRAAGWIHVIEWDDWAHPREVARYQVPEAGTHNLWIEDDVMYVAYYNGGLRVVDVSGELRGDLYRQGREIAMWMPFDAEGFIPNSPFTWGPQPYKGHIFISDWNSGLWALKLEDIEDPGEVIGEPR